MSISCTLYSNTGFNTQNIPDSPSLLDTIYSQITSSPLEVFSPVGLTSIRFRVESQNFDYNATDYIRVGTYYYIVTGVAWQANDVVEYAVVMDYITTLGGPISLNYTDGITERVHSTDDSYGAWCAQDDLLAPSEPMQIDIQWLFEGDGTDIYISAVECTVDPIKTAEDQKGSAFTVTTGDDTQTVVVPRVYPNSIPTEYQVIAEGVSRERVNPGTTLYNLNGASTEGMTTKNALSVLRSLGLEQAVVAQVQYPNRYVICTAGDPNHPATFTLITGRDSSENSGIPFINTGAVNNRINYSEYTKYGIMTTAGNSAEFDPADIRISNVVAGSAPQVRCISDPHIDGKPYFRFKVVDGNSETAGFWRNCVGGMQWKQIPLIFTGQSGQQIAQQKFENSVAAKAINRSYQDMLNKFSIVSGAVGIAGAAVAGAFPTKSSKKTGGIVGGIAGAMSGVVDFAGQQIGMQQDYANYLEGMRNDLYDVAVDQSVVVPTVNFPFSSEIIRDFYGNGCLAYRYKYTANDVARIDKLLTMYGYKIVKSLEKTDFNNREKFNFVQCSNITITGNVTGAKPFWMNNGASAQLRGGVRVWHVLPSNYMSNGGYSQGNAVK